MSSSEVPAGEAQSRMEAQQRADRVRAFEQELQALERDGIVSLTEAQKQAVAEHHRKLLAAYAGEFDIDRDAGSKQMSLGMRIASLLGALALAASVFFLFYQFWGGLSTVWQVAILVGAEAFRHGHIMERLAQDVRALELFAGRTEALREAVAEDALPGTARP